MSIEKEIMAELKDAMKNKDQQRLDVIRQIRADVNTAKVAPGFSGEVDDALYQKIIKSYSTKMQKALKEYQSYDRAQDMVEKLTFEIEYLKRWLPKSEFLDEAGTKALIEEVVAKMDSPSVGKVMGEMMKAHKGKVDPALLNGLVKTTLGA